MNTDEKEKEIEVIKVTSFNEGFKEGFQVGLKEISDLKEAYHNAIQSFGRLDEKYREQKKQFSDAVNELKREINNSVLINRGIKNNLLSKVRKTLGKFQEGKGK